MKKLTLITALILACLTGFAQTKVSKDNKGNYIAVKSLKDTAHYTGHVYIDSKLKEWPVYIKEN